MYVFKFNTVLVQYGTVPRLRTVFVSASGYCYCIFLGCSWPTTTNSLIYQSSIPGKGNGLRYSDKLKCYFTSISYRPRGPLPSKTTMQTDFCNGSGNIPITYKSVVIRQTLSAPSDDHCNWACSLFTFMVTFSAVKIFLQITVLLCNGQTTTI